MVMSIPNMVLWVILFAKVKNHVFCRTVPKWWGCVDSVSFNPPFMMGTPNRTQVTLRSQCQCAITSFFFLVKSGPKLPRGYNVSVPLHLFFFFFPGQEWTQVTKRLQCLYAITSFFSWSRVDPSDPEVTISMCHYIHSWPGKKRRHNGACDMESSDTP